MTDDKSKMLENAISQIEKDYGKGAIMRLFNVSTILLVNCAVCLSFASVKSPNNSSLLTLYFLHCSSIQGNNPHL